MLNVISLQEHVGRVYMGTGVKNATKSVMEIVILVTVAKLQVHVMNVNLVSLGTFVTGIVALGVCTFGVHKIVGNAHVGV